MDGATKLSHWQCWHSLNAAFQHLCDCTFIYITRCWSFMKFCFSLCCKTVMSCIRQTCGATINFLCLMFCPEALVLTRTCLRTNRWRSDDIMPHISRVVTRGHKKQVVTVNLSRHSSCLNLFVCAHVTSYGCAQDTRSPCICEVQNFD